MNFRFSFLLILLFLIGCGSGRLSSNDAIEIAEKYIIDQGYTNKSIQKDTTELDMDIVEQTMSRSGILDMRFNTLKSEAVFANKKMNKWIIGFQNKTDTTRFRIVEIFRNGKRIVIPHQDLKLVPQSNEPEP